jgi:hypothetical protein
MFYKIQEEMPQRNGAVVGTPTYKSYQNMTQRGQLHDDVISTIEIGGFQSKRL